MQIYTWLSCSVSELSKLIADNLPQLLPSPAVGTRLDFELVYPDLRAAPRSDGSGRFQRKPLGSVVLSAKDPGTNGVVGNEEENGTRRKHETGDEEKTLGDAKFVIGDYIDCAIFPPLPNGDVAPLPRPSAGILGGRGGPPPRENGYGGPPSFGGRPRGGGNRGGGFGDVPPGEWRRGDPLPPGGREGGFGRGRGRGRGW